MGRIEDENKPQLNIERENLSYRQGVVGIVMDNLDRYLVVQMKHYGDNQWRFPGGGIEEGEAPQEALARELLEELGSDKFTVEKESQFINQYEWPDEIVARRLLEKGVTWRGQQQRQFLVSFTGNEEDIKMNESELKNVRWAMADELPQLFIFPNQWEQVERVLEDLLKE